MSLVEIICNAKAGRYRENQECIRQIQGRFNKKLVLVHETGDDYELLEAVAGIQERKARIVGVWGGDGTWSQTVTKFMNIYEGMPKPMFFILSGGTRNNLAKYFAGNNPAGFIDHIVLSCLEGKVLDTSQLSLIKAGSYYGCLFGVGVVTDFMDEYYRYGASVLAIGRAITGAVLSYYLLGKKSMFEKRDGVVEIDCSAGREYNLILAGTHDHIGLGLELLDGALEKPGRMRVFAGELSPAKILESAARQAMEIPLRVGAEALYNGFAKEMVICSQKPFSYTVDGEMHNSNGNLTVTASAPVTVIKPDF